MVLGPLLERMTGADRMVALLAGLVVVLSFFLPLQSGPGGRVVVSVENRTVFTAPLDQPRDFSVEGPLGTTHMQIDAGEVRITDSPCPQKICLGLGALGKKGGLLACVPNRVVVNLAGEAVETDYDLLSR
ncbi:MAG: hypothetical protein C0618_10110 [Desulfuromonas sp.]|nr:MAG: hypothetical protein C0618_10110 [Desulfuromonas sp.]